MQKTLFLTWPHPNVTMAPTNLLSPPRSSFTPFPWNSFFVFSFLSFFIAQSARPFWPKSDKTTPKRRPPVLCTRGRISKSKKAETRIPCLWYICGKKGAGCFLCAEWDSTARTSCSPGPHPTARQGRVHAASGIPEHQLHAARRLYESNIASDTTAVAGAEAQARGALAAAARLDRGREEGGAHVSLKCGT